MGLLSLGPREGQGEVRAAQALGSRGATLHSAYQQEAASPLLGCGGGCGQLPIAGRGIWPGWAGHVELKTEG